MKIEVISTRVKILGSLARYVKVTWKLRINGERIVKVTDYRDYEDSLLEATMHDLDYHEDELTDRLYQFIEDTDYSEYEI